MGNKKDSLGNRMKGYENISRNYLTRRTPCIIRLDGKAFHTFTRGMTKPFDYVLMNTMKETMEYLCANVQGCVFGYTQSDEITLVLTDYETITTDAWFGYNIQKMASIAASMATLTFNRKFIEMTETAEQFFDTLASPEACITFNPEVYTRKFFMAMFDARCFSIPKDEVCNCLIWRQQDATRNSIESVGHANFSQSQLHGKSCNKIQDMLWTEKGINWNDFPTVFKRGMCCYREPVQIEVQDPQDPEKLVSVTRRKWKVDMEPPIFTQEREYVERWL